MSLIIGNILGIITGVFTVMSTFAKTKKRLCIVHSGGCICNIFACFVLGGISGSVMAIYSLMRNILCYKFEFNKFWSLIMSLGIGVIAVVMNTSGLWGILPIIATVENTFAICFFKSTRPIKVAFVFNTLLWIVYRLYIKAYGNAVCDVFVIVFALYNVLRNESKAGNK